MTFVSIVHEVKSRAGFLVGASACAAAFAPFYGPIAGVPASFLSLAFFPITLLSLIATGVQKPPRIVWLSVVPTIMIYVLAVWKASPEQFAFLADTAMWKYRYEDYQSAKLLMISVALIPQIAAVALVAFSKEPDQALTGALIALSVLALAAGGRILVEQGATLIRTDEMTASAALLSSGYSRVSYGALLTIGAVASLKFRWGWVLAGVFLFLAALMSRRADTLVLVICLVGLACYLMWRGHHREWRKPLSALVLGSMMFVGLHNDQNVSYFTSFVSDSSTRSQMVAESLAAMDSGKMSAPTAPQSVKKPTRNILTGSGLGSYKEVTGSQYDYPHNIVLEIAIELGIFPSILMVMIICAPLFLLTYRALQSRASLVPLLTGTCLAVISLISLKAGEFGFLGKIGFLSALTLLAIRSDSEMERKRPH
nr:MAG TPA: O-Antigen ligase [Bacteriophage sp.]